MEKSPEMLYAAGVRGVLADPADVQQLGWKAAFAAQRSAALGDAFPSFEEVRSAPPSEGLWRCGFEGVRTALAQRNQDDARRWLSLLSSAPPFVQSLAGGMSGWLAGEVIADDSLKDAVSEARAAGEAELVLDGTTLRALVALAKGDDDTAREHARLASRMARTESIPQSEYFANIVLATVRRRTGYAHLAGRILTALSRIASPRWQEWVHWEATLAGTSLPPSNHPTVRLLRELLAAAQGAQREVFEEGILELRRMLCSVPARQALDTFHAHVDWRVVPSPKDSAFLQGHHACVALRLSEEKAMAFVLARPGDVGRRVLAPGQFLCDAPILPPSRRKKGRAETLLSILALAGPEGRLEADVFRAVYGFAYVPDMHRGTFDVLLHRARQAIADFGEVKREGSVVVASLHRRFLLVDPRCSESPEARMLRTVASGVSTSAKSAAQALGVPLRQAQGLLRTLMEDGALVAEKAGGKQLYRVEDTTFSEPTRSE